jgi:isopentenyl-diphosphate Delta-isomerase
MKYDLVDYRDHLVRTGTKEDAKKLRLFTRSVHIWLINKKGELLVCKRSADKKSYPNKLTSSAGGHVDQGEDYKVAAQRELKEELGVATRLKDLGRFDVVSKKERTIHHLFIGKTKQKIDPDPGEIADYYFCSFEILKRDVALHPKKYSKPFLEALKHYLK